MAESIYTFYPTFQEYVTLYRGVIRVWIGDGFRTGNVGELYSEYIDGATQNLGPVSSYAIAKAEGYPGTQEEWVVHIAEVSQRALDAEAWATGKRFDIDVEPDDETYHNNAKYYSEVANTHQLGAEAAQHLAEQAQSLAEDAQHAAELAQSLSEEAQSRSETAQGLAEEAQQKAEDAQGSAETAQSAAEAAQSAAETAQTAAQTAQTIAESSATSAQGYDLSAQASSQNALTYSRDSEAWAVGQQNGINVPVTDPRYHNNSKYYAERAAEIIDSTRPVSIAISYQNSNSGSMHPTGGTWTIEPAPESGKYLWTKIVFTWTNGSTDTFYNVSYIGVNGTGSVNSVNGMGGDVLIDGTNSYIDASVVSPETIASAFARIGISITDSEIDNLFNVD